jgi:transposase
MIHSKYQRSLKDIPCFAHKTLLQLTLHKFYCRNSQCPQKIFTERFNEAIAPYKRMTNRLSELISSLVLQLSGRCAECFCRLLHIEISDTTLARMLHQKPLPEMKTLKVLGVDDWAVKKRHKYGTILVDLEAHKIIDVLQDRESSTLQKWLEEHPGAQILSRDRYTN